MTDDSFRKILEAQESLRRQMEPFHTAMRALHENGAVRQLKEMTERHRELMRVAAGPLENLKAAGLFGPDSELTGAAKRISELVSGFESSFRLPETGEAHRLLGQYEPGGVGKILEQYKQQSSELQRTLEAINAPWLDIHNQLRSFGAFAELQGIGQALRLAPAFDARFTEALRVDLGDWRVKIAWPAEIFNDPFARSAFYQQKGLDPALTEFPAASFQQNLLLSGLSGSPPLLIEEYDRSEKLEPEDDFEEAAFARTNKAHDRLTRFETQLRRFIEERLRDGFGEDWIKHRVPGDIQKKWTEKRQKARDQGERESPLIAYADFTDYVPIITKRDNWNDVFKPFFVRQTAVQESFQRLYPIRICTMHARLITQDDELYLLVETKRILTSIGTGA
ncbi:MAG: Swt1 family HEPN domain-containing protein [Mesorhizobium sp.]